MQIGEKKNRLILLETSKKTRISKKDGKVRTDKIGLFKCDCGKIKKIIIHLVKSGNTSSCGCVKKELIIAMNTTHEMNRTPEYSSWQAMKNRCLNNKSKDYKKYGSRGITVCNEWLKFENFYKDMGNRPEGTSIDRIDVNGNYEPSNCRWATEYEQQNNRRNNHSITAYDVTLNISQWAQTLEIPHQRIHRRLKAGWSHHDALFMPKNWRM